jgi:hypothetical protein
VPYWKQYSNYVKLTFLVGQPSIEQSYISLYLVAIEDRTVLAKVERGLAASNPKALELAREFIRLKMQGE